MTTARKNIVDVSVTRWYHCLSRCVRGGYLMGDGYGERKQWIEDRLELLNASFAVSVGGFAIMDNHLHVLVRLDPEDAKKWSAKEVIRRWMAVFPPKTLARNDEKVVRNWIEQQAQDLKKVEVLRERLSNLGWFMKSPKEPLSRLANKEDGCRGAFWEARYKSIAIWDTEALLATCAYIDLNPVAAGIAETPEKSPFTSLHQRVDHVQGLYRNGKARMSGAVKEVFERLGTSQACWTDRIKQMLTCRELRGNFFASDSEKVRQLSGHRGKRTCNLCPQVLPAA